MKNYIYNNFAKWVLGLAVCLSVISCDEFLEADPPTGSLTSDNVFVSDATALSAVSGVYAQMMSDPEPNSLFNGALGVMAGLSSDDLNDASLVYPEYETNQLVGTGNGPLYYMWSGAYSSIYQLNACIIGMSDNAKLTQSTKDQLLGECYFLRALHYFYLINLYGAVPLVTGTSYKENMTKSRTASGDIYTFILDDLAKAENLLVEDYPSEDRARVNKFTAQALLARVNLYLKQYQTAKDKATVVINGSYELSSIDQVFKKSSTETIWQLASVSTYMFNTYDANFYDPNNTGRPTYTITGDLYDTFEAGDERKVNWIKDYEFNDEIIHYPAKYTQIYEPDVTEYNIMFRLAEQYLIRAEAEANLNELGSAVNDLNKIRQRADIGDYSGAITKEAILSAIAHERRAEFFTEHGHRWFDLKRTNTADGVLGALKPTWKSSAQLWPVPQNEINANKNLLPNNEGY